MLTPDVKEIFIKAIVTATTETAKENEAKFRAGFFTFAEKEAWTAETIKTATELIKRL